MLCLATHDSGTLRPRGNTRAGIQAAANLSADSSAGRLGLRSGELARGSRQPQRDCIYPVATDGPALRRRT